MHTRARATCGNSNSSRELLGRCDGAARSAGNERGERARRMREKCKRLQAVCLPSARRRVLCNCYARDNESVRGDVVIAATATAAAAQLACGS